MNQSKYRYNKAAGQLNEFAPPANVVMASPRPSSTRSFGGAGDLDFTENEQIAAQSANRLPIDQFGRVDRHAFTGASAAGNNQGLDRALLRRNQSMFYYIVEDGQRVRMIKRDGTVEIITGPARVWKGRRRFELMPHYVAHPGE